MTGARPPLLGVRHVALFVPNLEAAESFWCQVMGYAVEWRPDPDNVYLSSGSDNLALHRAPSPQPFAAGTQRLDHIGLAVPAPEDVDAWSVRLAERVSIAFRITSGLVAGKFDGLIASMNWRE